MGIFSFYKNRNHHLLLNNAYTQKINDIEIKCYIKLLILLDKIEEELNNYLETNILYLNETGISFNILNNIKQLIFNNFYYEYAGIIELSILNVITNTILRSIMNNYNSQVEIGNMILDSYYTTVEYKLFVMTNIIKISVKHALNNISDLTNIIIKKEQKKNVATFCIQKNLRFVITNPDYRLCKNRIKYEYENMEKDIKSI